MVLRNVPKTFTFEEQRIEINEIAQDLVVLENQIANLNATGLALTDFSVSVQGAGVSNLVYNDTTGIFLYTPPDLSSYLQSESDPVFTSHPSFGITAQNITDWGVTNTLVTNNHATWNTAYGWGDHSSVGYLTSNIIVTSDTPPASPTDGTLWWNSDDGNLKVYYDDGNSLQWVDALQEPPVSIYLNDLINVHPTATVDNGDVLKWDGTQMLWVPSPDLQASGIQYTDLSVANPQPPALLGGLSYDSNDGSFTYTPPDLSAYWVTDNVKIQNWDTAYTWGNHSIQGYINGIGSFSIGALLDVDTTTTAPSTGDGLVWDNVSNKWKPGAVGGGGGQGGLSEAQVRAAIDVVKPNPTASGFGDLTYDNNSGEFTYTPPNLAGYLTSFTETDPIFTNSDASNVTNAKINNWDAAYGWGDHSTEGYLTSYTETDPVFVAHASYNITSTKISNWDTAYGWGNHASGGYLTSLGDAAGVTTAKINNWDEAHGWGDHSTEGYLTSAPAETDPTVPSHVKSITAQNITDWNAKSDVSSLDDLSDVGTSGVGNGDVLKYNGNSWAPATDESGAGGFPSGTVMLFQQSSAPTGWVKNTSANNNSALRVVTGSASTGGSVDFTTAFASRTPSGSLSNWNVSSESAGGSLSNWNVSSESTGGSVGNRTLSVSQMPSHSHRPIDYSTVQSWGVSGGQDGFAPAYSGNTWLNNAADTSSAGGGSSHNHTFTGGSHNHNVSASFTGSNHDHDVSASLTMNSMNFQVKYTDVISAAKA